MECGLVFLASSPRHSPRRRTFLGNPHYPVVVSRSREPFYTPLVRPDFRNVRIREGIGRRTTVGRLPLLPPYTRAPARAGGAGRLTNSISTAPEKLSAANTVKGTRYVPVVSNM